MEESEKRRERLRAIRMEATSQEETGPSLSPCSSHASTPPAAHLSNPLAHPAPPPTMETTPPAPRFDFYTDPMSAFSGSKRRSGGGSHGGGSHGRGGYNPPESFSSPIRSASPMSHPSSDHPSAGPRNYHMATPGRQFQVNQSPDQSPYEMPLHVAQNAPWRSPVPFGSPFSGPPGVTPVTNTGVWNRSGGSSGHGFPPNSSRGGFMSPGLNRSGGSSGHGFPSNSSRGGFMSPGFGRGGSSPMSNSGRGSPHSFSGRGRNWWSGGSPSPGRTGVRGRGFHDHGSGRQEFYIKTMVKDPWRKLKPIVGNILLPQAGPGFWQPKSMTAKKAKTAAEGGNEFNSQSSLADCLALSFEEAINNADS